MPKTPQLGVTAVFNSQAAQKRIKQYEQRIKDLEDAHKKLASKVKTSSSSSSRSVQQSTRRQMNVLRKFRWEIITLMFYVSRLAQAVSAAFKMMDEAAESAAERGGVRALARTYEVNLGPLAEEIREVANASMDVRTSIQVAQSGMLHDQGQFASQYAELWESARVAMVTSGVESTEVFEAFIEALATGDATIVDSATPIFQLELAMHKYAEETGRTVDQLDVMERAQVALNTIYEKTDELLAEGADSALAEREAFDKVKAGWNDLKDAMGIVSKRALAAGPALDKVNDLLHTMSQLAIMAGAGIAQMGATLKSLSFEEILSAAAAPGGLQAYISTHMGQHRDVYEETFKAGIEALGMFEDEVEEGQYEYERLIEKPGVNLDPIIDHIVKREDLVEKHNHRMEQISIKHDQRIEDIELQHQHTLDQIARRAVRDSEKAERKYNRRVLQTSEKYYLKQQQDLESHLLKMAQREFEYRQTNLQNERLYQYERSLLVAEGDVLAIEDLDARYELEQQAREENFNRKQQEEEDDFVLDQAHAQEKFEQDLEFLRQNFDDQLLEIQIRMQEQIEEAHYQRQQNLRQAQQDYEQELANEEYRHEQSLEQWNQYWAKLAEQTGLAAQQITDILEQYFGVGGVTDQIITDFIDRLDLRGEIRSIIQDVTGWSGQSESYKEVETYGPYVGGWMHYQHGGEAMVSRPTPMIVGEGHAPEIVSVRGAPTPAASAVNVSWRGAGIPIVGQGSMAGVDLSGVGDAIAQGLIIELYKTLDNTRR